ncbi:MAG: peptidoglycan -binding protein [Proteobacteria bacterium]|nr:peptidoglycan -binding protein [Pseudomonadota bacterium]
MTALRRRRPLDIWPAFVDATASLLMVVVFALLLAVLGHLVLSTALTGRDEALAQLSSRINKLAEILSLEQAETARLEQLLSVRTASLDKANEKIAKQLTTIQNQESLLAERETTIDDQEQTISEQIAAMEKLRLDIEALTALRDRIQRELEQQLAEHETIKQKLQEESELNIQNIAQIELLNQQLEELRQQLSAISSALEIAEKDIAEKQTKIDELGERLNTALANKALLLQKYRSEFFGRLRDALSQYPNIRIEGDRFVFPSELLFESGSDKLGADGKQQVKQLATTLNEISKIIPDDIDWILRIDGHTDKRPILRSEYFKSNWELSTARAISIVREMINHGIPPARMAATGFAEHHPVDSGETPQAYAKNRRIELKLTSR